VEYEVDTGPFLTRLGTNVLAQGASNWSANVTLQPGKNAVRFRSIDFAGNSSRVLTQFYTYVSKAVLTVTTTGVGTVVPDLNGAELEIGEIYTVTARPGPGYLFAGWEGVPNTTSSRLSFEMVPGLNLVAHFVANPFLPKAGTYSGIFYNTNSPLPDSSGSFKLQLAPSGIFTGRLITNRKGYPFRARFDVNGSATVPVLRNSLAPAVLFLRLDLSSDTNQITGFVTSAQGMTGLVSQLFAERNLFNSTANPVPRGFLLKRVSDQAVIGTGVAAILKAGAVQIHGRWSNGFSFGLVSALFQYGFDGGNVPFYLSYRAGTEIIIGLAHFGLDPSDAISGQLAWVRLGTNGFSTQLQMVPTTQ